MNFKDHMEHLKTFFTPSVKNVILLIRWLIKPSLQAFS